MRSNELEDRAASADPLVADWCSLTGERLVRSHRRPRSRRGAAAPALLLAAVVGAALSVVVAAPTGRGLAGASPTVDTDPAVEVGSTGAGDRGPLERAEEVMAKASRGSVRRSVATRWVAPVRNFRVTSCFGPRWGRTHEGLDMALPSGRPIVSVGEGVVVQAGWRYRGAGYSVVLRHAGGWYTTYMHASRVLARVGQRVVAGTLIALVGSTGHSYGPHLHLGVARPGTLGGIWTRFVDPASWLDARGVSLAPGC